MIVFVDIESTGLDERTGHLLEVAMVVTDDELHEEGFITRVMKPIGVEIDAVAVDDVVRQMHTANGLFEEVKTNGARRFEAEADLINFIGARVELGKVQLAGSTIAFDRRWLRHHMEKLEAMFHYRSIDVSCLTELAQRWAPEVYNKRPKAGKAHRALADARESIDYLRFYREVGFVGGGR